jgi:non-ribosomal peptide synthetase component F
MAGAHGASLYHALLALVALVLHDVTGQQRIGVLTPMANRETADAGRLVAYLANTLPIVQDIAPHRSFGEQIEQARDRAMAVLGRQRLPLAEIVRRLARAEFGPAPAVPYTLVNYIEPGLLRTSATLALAGVRTTPLAVPASTSPAPLVIALLHGPEQLTVQVTYDPDLVAAGTAATVAADLESCARRAAQAGPGTPIAELRAGPGSGCGAR